DRHAPIRDIDHAVAGGAKCTGEEELASPFGERLPGRAVHDEFFANVLLMLLIPPERISDGCLEKDPAVSPVVLLVSEEAGALLHGVSRSDSHSPGHIRHGEAHDGGTADERLP